MAAKPTYQDLENQIAELKKHSSQEEGVNHANAILNNMGDPVFMKDSKGRLLVVNDAFCELFNLSKDHIIGKTLAEDVSPDERKIFRKIDRLVFKSGIENINEESLTVRSSQTKIISTRKTRFIDSEGNKFLIGVVRDITKRKLEEEKLRVSEERLKSIMDSSPFPIVVVDVNNQTILHWSKSAKQLFGHHPKTSQEWYELAYPDPDYRNGVLRRWKPLLEIAEKTSKVVNAGEYSIVCKDGSSKICEFHVQILQKNIIITTNDITERKNAEKKLAAKMKQLEIFNSTAVDRELKMIELKKEINALIEKTGGERKYL